MKRLCKRLFLVLCALFLTATPLYAQSSDDLRSFLTKPSAFVEENIRYKTELNALYAAREYKPVWAVSMFGDRPTLKAFVKSAAAIVEYHALRKEDYPFSLMEKLVAGKSDSEAIELEVLVTGWLLKLAHDLHGDTVNLSHLYPGWAFEREPVDFVASLAKAIQEKRVQELILALEPTNTEYAGLAKALKHYRTLTPWPTVQQGSTLKPGDRSSRIAQIRARLAAENYLPPSKASADDNEFYDEALAQAVASYQARNGLKPDGSIGAKTVAAMNVSLAHRIEQIEMNMERWRHLPRQFPDRYASVNIADASVDVFEDKDNLIYHSRVIVGRPDRRTPFIQSALRSVIFNPSWHVPAKIARKDILPKLRKDPHYLEKLGFVISGSADDPYGAEINWKDIEASEFNFRLRQTPGDLNSLGRIKFDFDNDFSVYMHGTPHQELFDKAERNLSSGCVRLEEPYRFAEIVLRGNEGDWSVDRVREEVDKNKTRWLRIEEPLPLYFLYWTAFADGTEGPLNFRNDVYNYDRLLMESLRDNRLRGSSGNPDES